MAIGDNNSNFDPQWDYINRCGFVDRSQTSIGFNDGTYTFTLTDSGNGWRYFRNGESYFIAGNKTVTLPGSPPVAGNYFIVISSTDGTLSQSGTPFNLEDDNTIPVALVVWNDGLTPKYLLMDERHTSAIDRRMHWYEHSTNGTKLIQGGALTGYTVTAGLPLANTYNTFAISEVIMADEDIKHTLALLADESNYFNFFRSGATTYNWESLGVPFKYTPAGYINYDASGTMTQGQNNRYYNTYLLYTNITGDARYAIMPGRGEFTSLALANAEDIGSFTFTGFPIQECIIAYRLTWLTNSAYTTLGKCKLAQAPVKVDIGLVTTTLGTPGSAPVTDLSLTASPSTDHTCTGVKITLTAAQDTNFGDVCYVAATGKATLADADAIATSSALVMCADSSISTDAAGRWLLIGVARDDTWNWTVGGIIYLSLTGTTGNTLTQVAPSATDDVIQILGVALSGDTMHFYPMLSQVEHT